MRSIVVTVAAVLMFASCAGEADDGASPPETDEETTEEQVDETTTTEAPATTEATTTTTTEPPTAGTRENPVPAGQAFTVGDWQVAVGPTNRDAGDVIQAENQFNEPPPEGMAFVMAEITVAYQGDESGTPWIDLSFDFLNAAGNTPGLENRCGVIPSDLYGVGEMFTGASGSGNVCVAVAVDQIEGGMWIVEEAFSLDDESRVFVGLG